MSETLAILVSSFDGFSDAWGPFFHAFHKYWPDCPYRSHIVTNYERSNDPSVTTIAVGEDRGWSTNLRVALERLDADVVLYIQEDYWLRERVDTARIESYREVFERNHFDYLRLVALPPPDLPFDGDRRLGLLSEKAPYRTAVQASLWRKSTLQSLLQDGESAWQFELRSPARSAPFAGFACVRPNGDDVFYFGLRYVCTAINRGKWSRKARRYARKEGIRLDLSRREIETWRDDFRRTTLGLWTRRVGLALTSPAMAWQKVENRIRGKAR